MRQQIILNDRWEFALVRGFGETEREEAEKLSYRKVTLPHDWMVECPFDRRTKQGEQQGFFDRWGTGWYRRKLTISPKKDRVYRLQFDGVYENSTVWVNDICLGGRKYGYSGFGLDITGILKDGENSILVKADNRAVPADRWYSGAGIYRKVTLEILPLLHFDREKVQVLTEVSSEKAVLTVETGLEMPVEAVLTKGELAYRASSPDGKAVLDVQDPVLWSAETPEMYGLALRLFDHDGNICDEISFRIGLRAVSLTPDRGLSVNGRNVKLKGLCIHQDAGCLGTAVQKEVWRERLEEFKKIGCNALRLAHHLYMPEMLDLCDEMGFYVYEECFDKWTGGAYGRYYETEWERDLTDMVLRDRNRPSILFWGVGNEVELQAYDSMLELLEKHVRKVKELDPSRPVSLAMNPHFSYPEEAVDMSEVKDIQQFVDDMKTGEIFDMDDRVERIRLIGEKVDFLSCNYQEQWYERIHRAIPDKAILGTETYMYFRGYEEKFQNFSEQIPWWDVEEKEYCIGGMIWTGIDYLGESMGYPAKGWSGALFALDMEKRPIAWLYQSYWTKEPMVHFAVMDYSVPDTGAKEHWDYPRYESHWEFPQFSKVLIPYMIATNCQQVEIQVGEKHFTPRPTAEYPNRMITGFLPYLNRIVTIVGKNEGKEVARQVIRTPGMAVKLKFEQEEQHIRLASLPYQKILKVRAYDEDDNPVFRESAAVRFVAEGPAEIIGVENGDIKTAEPFTEDSIHLFQGRADVAVRIAGPGRVRVTAYAAGMRMAQTVLCGEGQ